MRSRACLFGKNEKESYWFNNDWSWPSTIMLKANITVEYLNEMSGVYRVFYNSEQNELIDDQPQNDNQGTTCCLWTARSAVKHWWPRGTILSQHQSAALTIIAALASTTLSKYLAIKRYHRSALIPVVQHGLNDNCPAATAGQLLHHRYWMEKMISIITSDDGICINSADAWWGPRQW